MSDVLDTHLAAYQGNIVYDFDNRILMDWYARRIIEKVAGANSLLELGLGHGLATSTFSGRFARHSVVEGSPAVIRNFRAAHPMCTVAIVECHFEEYTTADRYDIIVMGFVLEHVAEPIEVLRRFRTFLAPGGRLFIAVPNAASLNRRLGHLAGLLDNLETLSAHDLLLGHKRYYTVASLADEIAQSGYRIEKIEGIYLKPLTTAQMVSLDLEPKILEAFCKVGIDYPELCSGILAEASVC